MIEISGISDQFWLRLKLSSSDESCSKMYIKYNGDANGFNIYYILL